MPKLAIISGSNGVEISVANTDIIDLEITKLGWGNSNRDTVLTRNFEFYAIDDIEVSVNGRPSFILKSGDEIEERIDFINSFVLITDGARYRYYVKF